MTQYSVFCLNVFNIFINYLDKVIEDIQLLLCNCIKMGMRNCRLKSQLAKYYLLFLDKENEVQNNFDSLEKWTEDNNEI